MSEPWGAEVGDAKMCLYMLHHFVKATGIKHELGHFRKLLNLLKVKFR